MQQTHTFPDCRGSTAREKGAKTMAAFSYLSIIKLIMHLINALMTYDPTKTIIEPTNQ